MPYFTREHLANVDPAVAADLVIAAEQWAQRDADALSQVPAFIEQADHPLLAGVDYADPKVARAIGHHILGATLNTHQLLDRAPLQLNALYYPAYKRETLVDEAGNTEVVHDVDAYPRHLIMTGLLPVLHDPAWQHPLAASAPGFGKNGDYLCSAVMALGCLLDRYALLPYRLADLNGKFLDYRSDLDTATEAGVTLQRLGAGVADLRLWVNRSDDIARVLRQDVSFEADTDDDSVVHLRVLKRQVQGFRPLPTQTLAPDKLQAGELHLGRDLPDGADVWLPLSQLTHTLIAGETGSGKSTWTVSIIEGLLAQGSLIEHLYLCDLKQVEFAGYGERAPHVTVVDELPDLFDVVDQVHAAMVARLTRAKAQGQRNSDEPFIVLVIDEFANLTLMEPFLEGDEKKRFKQVMNRLLDIGMRARSANIRLVISLQHPIDKHIPSALKFNCPTKVMFRVPSRSYIALMFGDADEDLFPVHPRDLTPGQGYYQRPGQRPRLLQGLLPASELAPPHNQTYDAS